MDVLCIEGLAPGQVIASVTHGGLVRRLCLEVARHQNGGWKARTPGGSWSLRCNAVATAILLEASEVFADSIPSATHHMELAAD